MSKKIIYPDKIKQLERLTKEQIQNLKDIGYLIETKNGKKVGVLKHEKKPV